MPRRLIVCLLTFAVFAAAPAAAAGLASHVATYKIRLSRANAGGGMEGMSGLMTLEVRDTCEGLAVNQRLITDFWEQDGIVHRGDLTASSWEPKDGQSMRFTLTNRIDGEIVEGYEAEATRATKKTAGIITYKGDAFPPAPLPDSAIFPREHLERLLKAAAENARVVEAMVYDGAAEGTIYAATAVVGRAAVGDSLEPGANALKGQKRWPVVLSYFPYGSDDSLPDYETSFFVYENGVSSNLVMDYGDFALRGTLDTLELLDAPACE